MKHIATDVMDSTDRMVSMLHAQVNSLGLAMDPYFYRSHVTYQAELKELVFKSWLYAGHISELQRNGDYFLFDIGEDSVIICRDNKGQIRAHHNICRHRGARVCEQARGNRKAFVCPYHGWAYDNDGSLRVARDMDMLPGFDAADFPLKAVRLEIYQGLIFINCDNQASAFTPFLEPIDKPLGAYDLTNAKVAESKTYKIDANWKLCLENYLECYHCGSSHRQYAKLHSLQEPRSRVKPLNDAMLARAEEVTGVEGIGEAYYAAYAEATGLGTCAYHSRYALYEGFKTGSADGQPVAPLMGNMQGYDGGAGDFQLGPLCFMLNYPDHCVLYRFTPRSLTQTDMHLVWFVNGNAEEGRDYDKKKLSWLWDHTSLEDEFIILRNSEGVNSQFFEPGPYHPEYEKECLSFISWYLKFMTRATQVVA